MNIKIGIILSVGVLSLCSTYFLLPEKIPVTQEQRVREIYAKIVGASGEINIAPGLTVVDEPIVNAYATATGIVIYTGIIEESKSDDEIALILGHELAHVLLGHVYIDEEIPWWDTGKLEAQADKLGAYYMMKAGYDVCEGRQYWLRAVKKGNFLYSDHPDYAYRYEQLNVNCSDEL